MREGVDYAFTPHPSTDALKRAGKTFVVRYFAGGQGGSKELTEGEAKVLSRAGLDIAIVWETSAGRAGKGGTAGAEDARKAKAQAADVGMPANKPIYFAIDSGDLQDPDENGGVHRYFKAVVNVLGLERVGAYGGYGSIKFLFDHRLIRYGWQTYAWSGGQWDKRAQLQQYRNGVTIGGADCDLDRSTFADFGQWRIGQPPPTPTPGGDMNANIHRDLRITDPPTEGEDVGKLQHATRRLSGPSHYSLPLIAEDDEFGRKTMGDRPKGDEDGSGARGVGYYLGAADAQLTGPVRKHLQTIIRAPWRRTPAEQVRGKKRYIARRLELRRQPKTERARLAKAILDHPNSRFAFVSPTGGSARKGLEQAAAGKKSYVAMTGGYVDIDLRILRFMLYLCGRGVTYINCVVNGRHKGPQHPIGEAVDIDKTSPSRGSVGWAASQAGVQVLDEDAFHWHVHT